MQTKPFLAKVFYTCFPILLSLQAHADLEGQMQTEPRVITDSGECVSGCGDSSNFIKTGSKWGGSSSSSSRSTYSAPTRSTYIPPAAPARRADPPPARRADPVPARQPDPTPARRTDPTPARRTDPTPARRTDPTPARVDNNRSSGSGQGSGRPQDNGRRQDPLPADNRRQRDQGANGGQRNPAPAPAPVSKVINPKTGAPRAEHETYSKPGNNGAKENYKIIGGKEVRTSREKPIIKNGVQVGTHKTHYDPVTGKRKGFEAKHDDGTVVKGHFGKNGRVQVDKTMVDGTRIHTDSHRGGGYIQKSISINGRSGYQRTYVNNVTHTTIVRNYYHDSYGYAMYAPSYHFGVGFMTGYMLGAWASPVYYPYYGMGGYGWGWNPNAWLFSPCYSMYCNPYANYFLPAPYYPDPMLWTTDFLLSEYLALHAQSVAQQAQASNDAKLVEQQRQIDQLKAEIQDLQTNPNPQVQNQRVVQQDLERGSSLPLNQAKDQIKSQIQAEAQAHKDGQSVGMDKVLADTSYHFLVHEDIDVSYTDKTGDSKDCTMDEGDLIRLLDPVAPGAVDAQLLVIFAKHTSEDSCPANVVVGPVPVETLTEMKNEFAAHADAGIKAAADHQGKGAMPAAHGSQAPQVHQNYDPNGNSAEAQSLIKGAQADAAVANQD